MIFLETFLYACGAGIVLSGGGAIIAAAASGYRQRMDLCKPRLVQPAPQPPVGTPWADYCRDAEAQEAELYRLVPSAFWLNPDGPLAPPPIPRSCDHEWVELQSIGKRHMDLCRKCGVEQDRASVKPEIGPPCPNRCDAPLLVMADHGGEASMWSCTLCGTDFTRAGRSRVGGKIARHKQDIQRRKERAAEMKRFEMGLDTPHDMMRRQDEAFQEAWSQPPMIYGSIPYPGITRYVDPKATMRIVTPPPPPLPCGCSVETAIWKETRANWGIEHRTSKCSQCKAWWEPASNDRTGRTLAQGSWVRFADGTTGPQYFPPARPTR